MIFSLKYDIIATVEITERQGCRMIKSAIASGYNVGDNVIYKNNGICRICDIKEMNFTGTEKKLYYVLAPVYSQGSHTYVPVDLPDLRSSMHDLIDKKDIDKVINDSVGVQLEWPKETKVRAEYLSGVLSEFDRTKTLAVVKLLLAHKGECEARKKKMYASDMKLLTLAEKMIRDEFAFVLGINREDVFGYIDGVISK